MWSMIRIIYYVRGVKYLTGEKAAKLSQLHLHPWRATPGLLLRVFVYLSCSVTSSSYRVLTIDGAFCGILCRFPAHDEETYR